MDLFLEIFQDGCLCLKKKEKEERFIRIYYNKQNKSFTYKTRWNFKKSILFSSIVSCESENTNIILKYKDKKEKKLILGLPSAYKANFIANVIKNGL
jgi:hypothetical protein